MNRKDFLKHSILGSLGVLAGAKANAESQSKTPENETQAIGFNHLPTTNTTTMNTVLHKADTRGYANHGWLESRHSFSFASYHNPQRMNFGVLRVLNDDYVAPSRGFGKHPHDNMEIISIPLEGDLEHKDSMGTTSVIKAGDIQVMSAGTGVFHSEFNKSSTDPVKFLQIWVFPNKRDVTPRYDQISIKELATKNEFYQILSPNANDQGVWVHQDAWFHLGELEAGTATKYQLKKVASNGVYAFVLSGKVSINGQALEARDGYGLWNLEQLEVSTSEDARVLLMEVPMDMS